MTNERLLPSAAWRTRACAKRFGSRPLNALVGVNSSVAAPRRTDDPSASAASSARTKSSSAKASNTSPVAARWRTRASAWPACGPARSTPHSSARGKKYSWAASARKLRAHDRQQPHDLLRLPAPDVRDRHLRRALSLAGKPALRREIRRNHLVLELSEQLGGCSAARRRARRGSCRDRSNEHEPRRLLGDKAFLVPARRRRGFRELEPIEGVARQSQHVRQLADRGER